jgi:hypothetical protein
MSQTKFHTRTELQATLYACNFILRYLGSRQEDERF